MRPPVACFSFFCCTAWPGGAGGRGPLLVYLAIYALFRFALEFLRGDAARGMGVFSTSQLLALVTLAAVLPLLIRHLRTCGKQPRL